MPKDLTPAGRLLVETFGAIRIINLPDRKDRRREMGQQLARLGLDFSHPRVDLFAAHRFKEAAGFPTPGTRGCYQSHLDVLREAANEGLDSVLILEDDLNFHEDIETLLPATLTTLNEVDWDIFFASLIPGLYAAEASPLERVEPSDGLGGCHFYALRGQTIAHAASFLEATLGRPSDHPHGGPAHVDGVFSVYRRLHPDVSTFVANPDLGYQRLSRTDIHQPAFYDRVPVLRGAASLARGAIKSLGFSGQLLRRR